MNNPEFETSQIKTHNWGLKWTEDEDLRLLQGIERYGDNDWVRVSELVGTRDSVKCIQRWDKVLRPDLIKGKWTDDEDDRLRIAVLEGFDHWGKVAEKMPGRTAKQCRERWTNYLDPTLLKTPFSPAEDDVLVRLQSELGNKWAAISRQLPGRTENSVKLRFNALMKLYGEHSTDRSSRAPSYQDDNKAAVRRKDVPAAHPGSNGHAQLHIDASSANKKQRVSHPQDQQQQLPYMFAPLQDTSLGLLPQQYLPHPFMMQTSMNGMVSLDHATMMQNAGHHYPKQNAANLMYPPMQPLDAYAMRPEHHMNHVNHVQANVMHHHQQQPQQQLIQPDENNVNHHVNNGDNGNGDGDDKKYAAVGAFGEAESSDSDH